MRTTELERAINNKYLLFRLAEQTPVFVVGEKFYYCVKRSEASLCTFKSNGNIFGVVEGPGIKVLHRVSEKELREEYEKYQKNFIAEELKNLDFGGDLNSNHKKLVSFTVREIFPYLRKDNSQSLDELLEIEEDKQEEDKKSKTQEKKFDNYVNTRIKEIGRLSDLLKGFGNGDYDFCINRDDVNVLNRVTKNGDLEIDGGRFSISYLRSFHDFKRNFAFEIAKWLSVEALKEKLKESREFKKFLETEDDALSLCSREEHSEKDFGFKESSEGLLVYVEVPDYVLKSPLNGALYQFSGHKIGIDLDVNTEGEVYLKRSPHSVGNVAGPFYGCGGLCMGNYSWESRTRGMPKGKAFAKYLTDARNVVLRGYRSSNVSPNSRLDDEHYSSRRRSEEEVKRKNLPITNINYSRKKLEEY